MVNEILLFISAAADLESERALLSRVVAEIPLDIGWRIVQSPVKGEVVDLKPVLEADLHLLLLGSDIRAPIGLEWITSRRSVHMPTLFLKQGIARTQAAQAFIRHIQEQAEWQNFIDATDLWRLVSRHLIEYLLKRAQIYNLTSAEIDKLEASLSELGEKGKAGSEAERDVTGESSVILTVDRYMPSGGVIIQPPETH